jgi:predicted  nucleic acid-binding Zn-ribbon protein
MAWIFLSRIIYKNEYKLKKLNKTKNINIGWRIKMNYKKDLSEKNQKLLEIADIKIENKEYTKEEIQKNISDIGNHIMSMSSKNGDILNAQLEFMPLINALQESIN